MSRQESFCVSLLAGERTRKIKLGDMSERTLHQVARQLMGPCLCWMYEGEGGDLQIRRWP